MSRASFVPSAVGALFAGDGVVVGEVGRVCVVIWRGGVTQERFERQRDALAEVVGRHPEGSGFLCVIEPTATPPSDELRRKSIEMVASHAESLKCVAVVIEGEGFGAAITRSVISGMALLHARKPPATAFGKVRDAVVWMHLHVRIVVPEQLIAGVEDLRELLDANPEGA